MAQPTNQELRQLVVELSDRAIDLATSLQACSCDTSAEATGGRDLNAMIQDMKAVRQRVEDSICGPPRDGSLVDDPGDDASKTGLDNGEDHASVADDIEPVKSPSDRAESPGPVVTQSSARAPLTLMGLPPEIRNMIWWAMLGPKGGFVSVIPYHLFTPRVGVLERNPWYHSQRPVMEFAACLLYTYESEGERDKNGAFWALRHVSREVYEEAVNEYWRRVVAEGLMLSFTCHRYTVNYYGIAIAWAFFKDSREEYLRAIRRLHLDLRRPHDDDSFRRQAVMFEPQFSSFPFENFGRFLGPLLDLLSARLTGLRHLSLTFNGWVPDVRQTPLPEVPPGDSGVYPPDPKSSKHWVTRMQNIRGLTRLRLRVVNTSEDENPIPLLFQDPDVLRTIHFLSMLRGSMLVNGDTLGVENMRLRLNYRNNVLGEELPTRVVVQCDDSWDEDAGKHTRHVEDDNFDPIDGVMRDVDNLNGLDLEEQDSD